MKIVRYCNDVNFESYRRRFISIVAIIHRTASSHASRSFLDNAFDDREKFSEIEGT